MNLNNPYNGNLILAITLISSLILIPILVCSQEIKKYLNKLIKPKYPKYDKNIVETYHEYLEQNTNNRLYNNTNPIRNETNELRNIIMAPTHIIMAPTPTTTPRLNQPIIPFGNDNNDITNPSTTNTTNTTNTIGPRINDILCSVLMMPVLLIMWPINCLKKSVTPIKLNIAQFFNALDTFIALYPLISTLTGITSLFITFALNYKLFLVITTLPILALYLSTLSITLTILLILLIWALIKWSKKTLKTLINQDIINRNKNLNINSNDTISLESTTSTTPNTNLNFVDIIDISLVRNCLYPLITLNNNTYTSQQIDEACQSVVWRSEQPINTSTTSSMPPNNSNLSLREQLNQRLESNPPSSNTPTPSSNTSNTSSNTSNTSLEQELKIIEQLYMATKRVTKEIKDSANAITNTLELIDI